MNDGDDFDIGFEPRSESELKFSKQAPKDKNSENKDKPNELYEIEDDKSQLSKEKTNILEESEDLAEITGIILGDGNILYKEGYKHRLRISSNKTDEKEYREYTKKLMEKLFNIEPKSYDRKNKNATDLVINNKEKVKELIEKGLKSGNKVKNQVNVPEWVKKNENFKISCLRGLFDTDGSVYLRNTQKTFGLNFKNGSLPLVKDFKEMCESIGIKTQKIPKPKIYRDPKTGKIHKTYMINIENRFYIPKFLYKVKPKKWDNHSKIIGMALLTHEDPKKRTIIKNNLDRMYPDKKVHYNEEFENNLRKLCKENGIIVNNKTVAEAIEKALTDKRKGFDKSNPYRDRVIRELDNKFKKKMDRNNHQ